MASSPDPLSFYGYFENSGLVLSYFVLLLRLVMLRLMVTLVGGFQSHSGL